MAWIKLGRERPMLDERGDRPLIDEEGAERPTEWVEHEPTAHLEFEFSDMTSTAERRWLDSVLDTLGTSSTSLPTVAAIGYEDAFRQLAERYVLGIKDGEGREIRDNKQISRWMQAQFDWPDVMALLGTLRKQVDLGKAKKKKLQLPSA